MRKAWTKNANGVFPWNTINYFIFNLIPGSSTLSAGLGWELTWSITSISCRSPHQGIIAQPTVQDPKIQARQNASGNGNMLSNMMRLQDDIRKSRSKPWLVAPSLEGPLVGIRLGKTKNALQEPIGWIQCLQEPKLKCPKPWSLRYALKHKRHIVGIEKRGNSPVEGFLDELCNRSKSSLH